MEILCSRSTSRAILPRLTLFKKKFTTVQFKKDCPQKVFVNISRIVTLRTKGDIVLFARRSILNLHHFVNAIECILSESCIKLGHVSLKIHINLHYSSFNPLYASFYFQLVFTFKHILRKGINNSSSQCFSDLVKASITHLYDALQMEEVSIFANSFGPTIKFTCEIVQSFCGKKSVNLPLIATEVFATVLDSAMYP